MLIISDIYFGKMDASNEIMQSPDQFLKNFYDIGGVTKKLLKDPVCFLVLGKKGTGKTAIGKYLEMNGKIEKGYLCKYVSFDDFDYKQFSIMKDSHSDEYEKYQSAWRWVLLSQLGALIATDTTLPDNEKLDDLKTLILTLFNSTTIPLSKLVDRKLRRGIKLDLKTISTYLGEDICEEKTNYSLEELGEVFETLLDEISYANNSYYLVIDGLDEKIKKDKMYTDSLTSLLWEAARYNKRFAERKQPIKIIITLRHDVFNLLGGANLNKLELDNSIKLSWTSASKNKMDFPLADLVALRINNSRELKGMKPSARAIEEILPEKVHGKNWATPSWDWMLDMTTYKPRDIVTFLNLCQKLCHNSETRITESIVWDALKDYSEYLVGEFKSELYGHLEKEQVDEILTGIFPAIGKTFPYEIFLRKLNNSKACSGLNAVEVLSLLYRLGVVGIQDAHNFIQWVYRDRTIVKKEISNSKFQIHIGLWKVLSYW